MVVLRLFPIRFQPAAKFSGYVTCGTVAALEIPDIAKFNAITASNFFRIDILIAFIHDPLMVFVRSQSYEQ